MAAIDRLPNPATRILLTAGFVVVPGTAFANLIWPEIVFTKRIVEWWIIAAGLVIEFLFLWWMFRLPLWKTLVVVVVANAVSALIGFVLLPWLGYLRELLLSPLRLPTFRLPNLLTALVLLTAFNVLIEGLVYRYAFGLRFGRRNIVWLILANAASAAVMFVSFSFVPAPLR